MNKKDILYDPIRYVEYEDDPTLVKELYVEYSTHSITSLLQMHERATHGDISKSPNADEHVKVINWLIAKKLSLPLKENIETLLDQVAEPEDINNKVKELETLFKNHRHPLDRNYGEKPVW